MLIFIFNKLINICNINGDFLLIFDNTIDTFVEISQSKFDGGISTLIPFKDSGNSISHLYLIFN